MNLKSLRSLKRIGKGEGLKPWSCAVLTDNYTPGDDVCRRNHAMENSPDDGTLKAVTQYLSVKIYARFSHRFCYRLTFISTSYQAFLQAQHSFVIVRSHGLGQLINHCREAQSEEIKSRRMPTLP